MIGEESKHSRVFAKRHLKLFEFIEANLVGWIDRPQSASNGKQLHGALVLTNQRVAFCSSGLLNDFIQDVALSHIISAETAAHPSYSTMRCSSAHGLLEFKTSSSIGDVFAFHDRLEYLTDTSPPHH